MTRDWVTDELKAERGEHAHFQMYTREGNDAVAAMLAGWRNCVRAEQLMPRDAKTELQTRVRMLAHAHLEVYDTEPRGEIADAADEFFDELGFARPADWGL